MQTSTEKQSISLPRSLGSSGGGMMIGNGNNEAAVQNGHGALHPVSASYPNGVRGEDLGRHLLRQLHLGNSKQAASEVRDD